jgi:adenylate cyclase
MKKLLLVLLLLPLLVHARSVAHIITRSYIHNDTTGFISFDNNWKICIGDDTAMARPGYPDSSWDSGRIDFRYSIGGTHRTDTFSSICWLRMHFITDSTLNNVPLSLWMTHYGASEVYVDGSLITHYGKIKGADSSTYYDPQGIPVVFSLASPGAHVIAIRYANYKAKYVQARYGIDFSGIKTYLGMAENAVARIHNFAGFTFVNAMLFGILLAFGIAHLFIFFFERSSLANIYLTLLSVCLSGIFYITYRNNLTNDPQVTFTNRIVTFAVASIGCLAFSGLANSLFGSNKKRFRVFAVICLANFFFSRFQHLIGGFIYVAMGIYAFVEVTILTVRAMYRKVKGSRIVGVGILFFTVFFFASIVFFSLHGDVSDGDVVGKIYLIFAALAILSIPVFMSLYLAWDYAYVNRSLADRLVQVEELSAQAIQQEQEKKRILEDQNEVLEKEVVSRTRQVTSQKEEIERQHEQLKTEKQKSDNLLLNILPAEVAEELKEKGGTTAKLYDKVTVMFTDFVDFTKASERMAPEELVNELHTCFKAFDEIISRYNIEKIKTIGDAYLAIKGLPEPDEAHAEKIISAGLDIIDFMADRRVKLGQNTFEVRVGVHSGSVVAGIVGVKKFAYDIWGDTVNTAARMEQNSEAGRINISQATYELVKDKFSVIYRGEVAAKNKGSLNMYFVDRPL